MYANCYSSSYSVFSCHDFTIVYLCVVAGSNVLPYLLEWLKWHNPEVSELAQVVTNQPAPDRHPHYWDVVSRPCGLVVDVFS